MRGLEEDTSEEEGYGQRQRSMSTTDETNKQDTGCTYLAAVTGSSQGLMMAQQAEKSIGAPTMSATLRVSG